MPRRRSATPNTGASSATKKPMAVTPSQPGGSNYTGTPAPSQKAALPVNESVEITPISYESEDDDDSTCSSSSHSDMLNSGDQLSCSVPSAIHSLGMNLPPDTDQAAFYSTGTAFDSTGTAFDSTGTALEQHWNSIR